MTEIARPTDHSTSHDASIIVLASLNDHQSRFLSALRDIGQPATAVEVAASVEPTHAGRETLRKRAGELLKAELIRECGRRTCRVTGATARVFVVAGWDCPQCNRHRSGAWLLSSDCADCPTCEAMRERVSERAAIAEFDGGLSRHEAEQQALNELYNLPN